VSAPRPGQWHRGLPSHPIGLGCAQRARPQGHRSAKTGTTAFSGQLVAFSTSKHDRSTSRGGSIYLKGCGDLPTGVELPTYRGRSTDLKGYGDLPTGVELPTYRGRSTDLKGYGDLPTGVELSTSRGRTFDLQGSNFRPTGVELSTSRGRISDLQGSNFRPQGVEFPTYRGRQFDLEGYDNRPTGVESPTSRGASTYLKGYADPAQGVGCPGSGVELPFSGAFKAAFRTRSPCQRPEIIDWSGWARFFSPTRGFSPGWSKKIPPTSQNQPPNGPFYPQERSIFFRRFARSYIQTATAAALTRGFLPDCPLVHSPSAARFHVLCLHRH
jgi:hypothetical protein